MNDTLYITIILFVPNKKEIKVEAGALISSNIVYKS